MDNKSMYVVESIVTVLSLRDAKNTWVKGRRVRHYVLSRETEEAVDIKRKYANGQISETECKAWVFDWLEHNEFTPEELDYLDKSTYITWLKEKCTTEVK